jgi:hypothetical protein
LKILDEKEKEINQIFDENLYEEKIQLLQKLEEEFK